MSGDMQTPWGEAHVRRQLEEGIFWVEAPEHGGLLIERSKAYAALSEWEPGNRR